MTEKWCGYGSKNGVGCKNDVPCSIEFPWPDAADKLDALKQALKGKNTDDLTVILPFKANSLPVLRKLKGSGVGILFHSDTPNDREPSEAASKELARAIVEVDPRRLTIDDRDFALLGDRLSKIESLSLEMHTQAVPDLSKLATLRHLMLKNESGGLELRPLEKLRN